MEVDFKDFMSEEFNEGIDEGEISGNISQKQVSPKSSTLKVSGVYSSDLNLISNLKRMSEDEFFEYSPIGKINRDIQQEENEDGS